jgi:hypothetical protein
LLGWPWLRSLQYDVHWVTKNQCVQEGVEDWDVARL